jgi:hypothetical protein
MSERTPEQDVEALLRATPPPLAPPAELRERARAAALARGHGHGRGNVRSFQPRGARLRAAAMLTAAAVAAGVALTFALVRGGEPAAAFTAHMQGPRGAWAQVELYHPDGAVRRVRIEVGDLPPAPRGHYYQLWWEVTGGDVRGMAFNTAADGSVVAETHAPSDQRWHRCWVTEDDVSGHVERTVMSSRRYG